MNYISVENLTKTYGIVTLFEDISFNINEGDKIAIVAKNGSGKTTLLNILMGKDFADSGMVIINKDIQVGLFDQEIHFESGTDHYRIYHESRFSAYAGIEKLPKIADF